MSVQAAEPLVAVPTAKRYRQATRADQDAYTTAFGLALGSHA
jgi:hypothetical protein